jgi:hypothetical protein
MVLPSFLPVACEAKPRKHHARDEKLMEHGMGSLFKFAIHNGVGMNGRPGCWDKTESAMVGANVSQSRSAFSLTDNTLMWSSSLTNKNST